jgi:hypothetical protein
MMAQLAVLVAGLLLVGKSQASDLRDRSTLQGFLSKYTPYGSDASRSSMSDYDKFITQVKYGNAPNALSSHDNLAEHGPATDDAHYFDANGQVQNSMASAAHRVEPSIATKDFDLPMIADREEKQAVQKLLANEGSALSAISLSAMGVGLLLFVKMLGERLRRGLQPATVLASSGRSGPDMPMNTAAALGGNLMEMESQDSQLNYSVVAPETRSRHATVPPAVHAAAQQIDGTGASRFTNHAKAVSRSVVATGLAAALCATPSVSFAKDGEIDEGLAATQNFLKSISEPGKVKKGSGKAAVETGDVSLPDFGRAAEKDIAPEIQAADELLTKKMERLTGEIQETESAAIVTEAKVESKPVDNPSKEEPKKKEKVEKYETPAYITYMKEEAAKPQEEPKKEEPKEEEPAEPIIKLKREDAGLKATREFFSAIDKSKGVEGRVKKSTGKPAVEPGEVSLPDFGRAEPKAPPASDDTTSALFDKVNSRYE